VVSLPRRDELIWQDSELIWRDEGWADCNFGVDRRGDELMLDVEGRAQLDFAAEVTFEGGDVQVVDFRDNSDCGGRYCSCNSL